MPEEQTDANEGMGDSSTSIEAESTAASDAHGSVLIILRVIGLVFKKTVLSRRMVIVTF